MTPFLCERWFSGAATLSHLRQMPHFLEDVLSSPWRSNPVSRTIAVTETLISTSIGFGKMVSSGVTSAIAVCSTWITRFVRRWTSSYQSDISGKDRHLGTGLNLFDEGVEITVRIDDRGFAMVRKPKCVVTVHLPKECAGAGKQTLGEISGSSGLRYKMLHHNLPFWAR